MSLVKWAFIGVILLPAAELTTFILVALTIGWLWTAVLFVGTSAVGVLVLRHTGRRDLDRFRAALSANGVRAIRLDTPGLAEIIGGILLVFPGFITDVLGALLFLPQFQRWAAGTIGRVRRKRRAARDPSVIDLSPNEWRQMPDAIEDTNERKPLSPRKRKDIADHTES
jgi:UPF0716 family protein affecting phage T7 exclusion